MTSFQRTASGAVSGSIIAVVCWTQGETAGAVFFGIAAAFLTIAAFALWRDRDS